MSEKQSNGLVALLRRPSSKYSVLTLLLVGVVFGVLFWGGFNTALEATNKEAFCISCHEMRENVYAEYKENTIHYTNRTGVRATCPDCHVPKEWGPKMLRKIQASREVWGKLTGTIEGAIEDGKTCIDCHKGIAHHKPQGMKEDDE